MGCVYCDPGTEAYKFLMFDSFGDGWNGAQAIISSGPDTLLSTTLINGGFRTVPFCLPTGCNAISVGGGYYDDEIAWNLVRFDGSGAIIQGNATLDEGFSLTTFYFNNDPLFDGSFVTAGCTDTTACNFDALAVCEDGSCIFPSCTDDFACNYDFQAICSDNTLALSQVVQI